MQFQHSPENKSLAPAEPTAGPSITLPVGSTIDHAERALIELTLQHTRNNKTRAAEILGVDESFRSKVADARARLAPTHIGGAGQIQAGRQDVNNVSGLVGRLSTVANHRWPVSDQRRADAPFVGGELRAAKWRIADRWGVESHSVPAMRRPLLYRGRRLKAHQIDKGWYGN